MLAAAGLLLTLAPSRAEAQGRRNLRLSLLAGVGGSVDEDQAGLGNSSFQVGFAFETTTDTVLRVDVGAISFDQTDAIGRLADPSVEYVTVGGEYQFQEEIYRSGLFFGLGAYRLEGLLAGQPEEETSIGLNLGATGDFAITDTVSVLGEIAFHVVESDIANLFATAHVGLALHF